MDFVFLEARAKINISLDIKGKREDGYHDLATIMQSINLFDTVFIKKTNTGDIRLETNAGFLPVNEKNIVYKAAGYMLKKFDIKSGLYIDLKKNIPISAGLAGGSSDCAATLVGMKKLFSLPLKYAELLEIGAELGSDVPFCINRGTYLAEGRGEILTKLAPHPKIFVVLAKPPNAVSTASVFAEYNPKAVKKHPDTDLLIKAIYEKDIISIANNFCNVLESVTERNLPIITDLKSAMIKNNALNAMMSGSGPTVFGYFINKNDAHAAVRYIHKNFKQVKEVFLTTVYNPNQRRIKCRTILR